CLPQKARALSRPRPPAALAMMECDTNPNNPRPVMIASLRPCLGPESMRQNLGSAAALPSDRWWIAQPRRSRLSADEPSAISRRITFRALSLLYRDRRVVFDALNNPRLGQCEPDRRSGRSLPMRHPGMSPRPPRRRPCKAQLAA